MLSDIHLALSYPTEQTLSLLKELEDKVLKVWLFDPVIEENIEIPEEILHLAEARKQAKTDKNYALADQLRAEILEKWWEVKDSKDGFELIKK